jgi:hypothetical protein
MRKCTFTLGCLVITLLAQAQIEKKDVLLGGNLGVYYFQNGPNQTGSNSSFQPFVQFAYKNNRTIGFNLEMYYSSNSSNDGQYKSQTFSLGPAINFTQYHPIKGAFGWWLQQEAGARFSNNRNTGPAGEQKSDDTRVFVNVTPGLFYAIGEKQNWLLTASVGGIGGSYSGSNGVDSWGFGTNIFQYYRFGFAYIFKK